jgi:transcription antitermination factor NusG
MKLPTLDTNWYVLRTKVRAESLAEEELRLGGFQAYVPRKRVQKLQGKNRIKIVRDVPLMPGYAFLATPIGRPVEWGVFRDERRYRHVGRPLSGLHGPLRVYSQVVIQIHIDEMEGKFDETGITKAKHHAKLAERYAAGVEFRVNEGPFIGFTVLSEGVTAKDRVRALVELFDTLIPVEFEPDQLEAA